MFSEKCDKEKLASLGSFLVKHFGTSELLATLSVNDSSFSANRMVLISENFPYQMKYHQKAQILALMENSTSTATKIFRQLIRLVIDDENIWADNNNASMMQKYPILNACIGTFHINNYY